MTKHLDTCPACGSQKIVPGAEFPDSFDYGVSNDARLRVPARPKALFFKRKAESPLEADVCGDCGHVQLYVTRPRDLWNAYRQGRGEE